MQDGGLNIASYNQLSKQEKKCEELILVNENMKTINKKSFGFIYSTTGLRICFTFESSVLIFFVKSKTKKKTIHEVIIHLLDSQMIKQF